MNRSCGLAVVGGQWGDEGKGKIVDFLASQARVVARFQGGNNAGHTVVVGKDTFKMHHLPVGVLYPGVLCVLGNGMVVNPLILLDEIEMLEQRGIDTSNIRISDRCHIILPYHQAMDKALETLRGDNRIGTTGLGIGPAYADKAYRTGLRMADFINPGRFRSYLEENLPLQNRILAELGADRGFRLEDLMKKYLNPIEKLAPYVTDTSLLIHERLERGDRILFEGSQGALLDLDHGTYPYVTSASTTAGGIVSGLGIGPHSIGEIMGVVKAYTTRVGEGPFPTEETGETGRVLRDRGSEYGTTTGRPRRCGWFDAVAARYAARINGLTVWAITKLDVLSGLKTIRVARAYEIEGRETAEMPLRPEELYAAKPVYEELPGWEEDITGAQSMKQLPPEACSYLRHLEEITGVKIAMISLGPDRRQTITITSPWNR